MKSIITAVIAIVLMSCTPTYASQDLCQVQAKVAETTMHSRQIGVPMYQMMKLVEEIEFEPVRDIARYITIESYEVPMYNSVEYKERAKSEFSNKIYKLCNKVLQRKK